MWDARTHKQLGSALTGHTVPVFSVAFSRDGRTLASASQDKTIRLWDGLLWQSFAELRTEVCDLVGSGLTRTEWSQYAAGVSYGTNCP